MKSKPEQSRDRLREAGLKPVPKTRVVTGPLPISCSLDATTLTLEFGDLIAAAEFKQAVKP